MKAEANSRSEYTAMSQKIEFVVALMHVKCPARLQNGIKLIEGLRLIGDPDRVACLKNEIFQGAVGRLELGALRNAKLLVASEPDGLSVASNFDGEQLVLHLLNIVRSYLVHLWFIRDNCAYFDHGFVFKSSSMTTHSNSHSNSFFKADGRTSTTEFSRKELEHFRTVARVSDSMESTLSELFDHEDERRLISGKGVDVYERFIRFVAFARETTDLGLKIAMYSSALETLLSHSSTSELTHKVSERVALLIAPAGQKRLEAFQLMKKLYSIRSSVVHGSDIAKKQASSLVELSKQADEIVRAVGVLYHSDSAFRDAVDSDTESEDYFLKKMFFA